MDFFSYPLKLKYRTRKTNSGGAYRQRTGNCHGPTPKFSKSTQGNGPRRKSYNTHLPTKW